MEKLILAIDIGTSAVKASLISSELFVLDSISIEYPTYFPSKGEVEQNADDWWNATCEVVKQIVEHKPNLALQISVIGLSGHMLGFLPVNREGRPLMRSLIHADARASHETTILKEMFGVDQLYKWTGNVLSPAATLSKAFWLRKNYPEIYSETASILQSKDYIVYKLTGGVFSTDYSDASHGMLINLETMTYMEDVFEKIGIDANKFPSLHKSHDVIGKLCYDAAQLMGLKEGIPVVAGGGDGACANIGAGLAQKGDIYCSLGTTAWIAFNNSEQYVDERHRVFNIVSLDGTSFGVFGTIQSAGRSVQWAQDLFNISSPSEYDVLASNIPAGSDSLIYLPYIEGERSPIFDPDARGVFFGMHVMHTKNHFLRAVLEGVAFALSSILDVTRKDLSQTNMRIIGGGAKSILWKQIIADICDMDLLDLSVPAASVTSLGAAIAAGVGIEMFSNYIDAVKRIEIKGVTKKINDNKRKYLVNKNKYESLYPRIKDIYKM